MVCDGDAQFLMASAPYIDCRDVEFRRFTTDPLVLIAPAGHPWARRGQIEPDELYGGDYIMREDGAGTLAAVREGLAGLGIDFDRLRTLIVLGNPEAIALA